MCDFRMWHQMEDNVYVLQCVDCNMYQIRMRNAAFMFEPFAYNVFRESVNDLHDRMQDAASAFPVAVPVINTEMELLLNENSLNELFQLLDGADTEIRAAQMVKMF